MITIMNIKNNRIMMIMMMITMMKTMMLMRRLVQKSTRGVLRLSFLSRTLASAPWRVHATRVPLAGGATVDFVPFGGTSSKLAVRMAVQAAVHHSFDRSSTASIHADAATQTATATYDPAVHAALSPVNKYVASYSCRRVQSSRSCRLPRRSAQFRENR